MCRYRESLNNNFTDKELRTIPLNVTEGYGNI